MFRVVFLICSALIMEPPTAIDAFQSYQQHLPNGPNVAHPCDLSTTWPGLGHKTAGGGTMLNQFGDDFRDNNYEWNSALCQMDSDGDGKTNGVELGDPNCVWTQGASPSVTNLTQLSHPGVCEPITASTCSSYNTFLEDIDICIDKINTASTTTSTTVTTTKATTGASSGATTNKASSATSAASASSTPSAAAQAATTIKKSSASSMINNAGRWHLASIFVIAAIYF